MVDCGPVGPPYPDAPAPPAGLGPLEVEEMRINLELLRQLRAAAADRAAVAAIPPPDMGAPAEIAAGRAAADREAAQRDIADLDAQAGAIRTSMAAAHRRAGGGELRFPDEPSSRVTGRHLVAARTRLVEARTAAETARNESTRHHNALVDHAARRAYYARLCAALLLTLVVIAPAVAMTANVYWGALAAVASLFAGLACAIRVTDEHRWIVTFAPVARDGYVAACDRADTTVLVAESDYAVASGDPWNDAGVWPAVTRTVTRRGGQRTWPSWMA